MSKKIGQEKKQPQVDVSKLSDFEISFLVLERDVAQYRMERYDELLNQIGQSKGFDEAQKKQPPSFVKEETFTVLKFEDIKSERLVGLQAAHKSSNLPDKWSSAYNILRQNNSTISSRYYDTTNYQFSYWLYGEDRIFRQPLKKT